MNIFFAIFATSNTNNYKNTMLKLNLINAIHEKGIENPNRFLKECGIPPHTASRLLNNQKNSINFNHLEMICLSLNCTIDDLFIWQPGKSSLTADQLSKHPLQKLKKNESKQSLHQKIKMLPFNKIEALKNFIDGLEE